MMGNELPIERGKKEWVQKEDLKWLLATRKNISNATICILPVDNIYENKDRIRGGKETIENCINRWGKNRAVVVSGTDPI